MNQSDHALIFGASGLVGRHLLNGLLENGRYTQVIAPVLTPLDLSHPSLIQKTVDFDRLEELAADFQNADVFICLGTTIKKAKSQEAFAQVDLGYPLAIGRLAKQEGSLRLLAVSAMGANAKSQVFYNRVKGEMEQGLAGLELPIVHVFRPSLLLGDRKEFRLGETAASYLMRALDFTLVGPLRQYRAIPAVAAAMEKAARDGHPGFQVHPSDDIFRLAGE